MPETCGRPRCDGEVLHRDLCKRHYVKVRATGAFAKAPIGPTREHVRRLRDLGWSNGAIADRCGVAVHAVTRIANPASSTRTLWQRTAAAILAIPLAPYPSYRSCPPMGTQRRVRALACLGWRSVDIAARTGLAASYIDDIRCRARSMTFHTAALVDEAYQTLRRQRGPSKQTASRAANRGWLAPDAWFDIDDPDEDPKRIIPPPTDPEWLDEVAVELTLADQRPRPLTAAEIRELFQQGSQRGKAYWECCRMAHISGARAKAILGGQAEAYAELAS